MRQLTKANTGSGETMSAAIRDRITGKWLRKEVLPIYDAIVSGRSSAVPADEAWAMIAAHIDRAASKPR